MRKLASNNPALFRLYALLTRNKNLLNQLSSDVDVVIAGFPRSGNTYSAFLTSHFFPNIRFAHHLHLVAPIKSHIKKSTPIIVLIRSPYDSIPSLWLQKQVDGRKDSLEYLCTYWIDFHSFVIDNNIQVVDFNNWINNPLFLINHIYEKTRISYNPNCNIPEYKGNANNNTIASMLPSHLKEVKKEELRQKMSKTESYKKCLDMYESIIK